MLKKLLDEIKRHVVVYVLLILILGFGLFLRVYNIDNLLGFYYDQGRDALTVWNLWHKGDVPFIGPTTGIAGIFRGPFYYYLIAPFYLLGGGNPVYPSVFLSLTTMAAVVLMYYLGFKIQDRPTGLLAAFISSFSFNVVMASRWLSNPTPMILLSVLFVWSLILIVEGKKTAWIWAVLIATVSLFHFGSAGEVFYLLTLAVLFIWKRKSLPGRKIVLVAFFLSLVTVSPLIAFDIKNHGLMVGNVRKFLVADKSFALPTAKFISDKIEFYFDVFTKKIFNGRYYLEKFVLSATLIFFVYHLHTLVKNKGVKILLILLGSVTLGLVFFQGNFGNIYDYYLTGYYLPFLLLFSIVLGYMWRFRLGKIFVLYFLYLFTISNADTLKFKLTDEGLGPNSVSFKAQKLAIDWIKEDAKGKVFNVDIYVPPVISYAYDYLLTWQDVVPSSEQAPLLYTLYEQDPPYPERLDTWLARQKGIGKVEKETRLGGITVQRRTRLED